MKKASHILIITLLLLIGSRPLFAQKKELSIQEALTMARQGNKTLQIQILEEKRATEQIRESKGRLLPDISAGVAYSYYFDRQNIFLPGSFAGTNKAVQEVAVGGRNAFNGFVSLYQPVMDLGLHRLTEASRINEKIQTEKTEDLKSRIALGVSTRYLGILMMKSQLTLLEQSYERNLRALKDSRALLAQGKGLKADTLRSYIAVENIRSSVSYLKNNIEVSGMELKRLIGLEDTRELELTDQLESEIKTDRTDFLNVSEALEIAEINRNDLSVQELIIAMQQQKLYTIKAELLPKIALIGQYQIQAQADNLKFNNYAWPRTSFLGLQISVPIFNGGQSKSRINQARILTQQEQVRLNDLKDEIKTTLASIISKWKEATSQLEIQVTTVQSAELNHQMTEDRFKNGLGSRLELTDAELALTQAKINYLQAVYNLRILHTELQHALGVLEL
ncbi:TolC family protein [Elizabethkingia anophelis]|uniref:Outer membrane channel protein n=1 Tax=Elizabethkingia anophelis TaxID=1117645 RepID=A0A7Z7LUQ1_9FLAO|nr:TolC family protein [Elizabethkingia anophelis]MCT3629695.1 TolC family protein [Elizabethkingia anophelis]MCT3633363.1 TolC family protein [Elizabethkingia anophelis]MCT3691304.1 TolC family protein [Elizabethkingia anophelis]MCT3817440.1 TolC family protein [Elizabethkingia anophelis]MCT3822773.1 TolC family protein [Elizabethkingia anophelis]